MTIDSYTPLTRDYLDTARCENPDCTEDHGPLYFHGACHMEAATFAFYEDGNIVIECAECEKRIATVAVMA